MTLNAEPHADLEEIWPGGDRIEPALQLSP
jgi:hypothetical protein